MLFTSLVCAYTVFGGPFGEATIPFTAEGRPGPYVSFTMYGKTGEHPLRINAIEANEIWNLTLAPDDPNNELQILIYAKDGEIYKSDLINNAMPIGKKLPGTCTEK
jgi:hypothetical protein